MSDGGAPSWMLLAAEPGRAISEYALFHAARPVLARAPRGDGHPVLVLPGFGADDRSTTVLRRYLRGLGYDVHAWRLGRNVGPTAEIVVGMTDRLAELAGREGRAVSIVGWSLGGIYGRSLALRAPRQVRQVITLGSPLRRSAGSGGHARRLYDRRAHLHVPRPLAGDRDLADRLPVPSTAINSKTDGIVDWRACTADAAPQSENIEVLGSHCGLGHNPTVLWIVADRLAQATGVWRPYAPRSSARVLGQPAG